MQFEATGVYPANITAKSPDGEVDLRQTKAVVEFLYSKAVDGLHVCGSTGEFATLKVEERKAVAEASIEAANGRGTVIVHVGAVSTDDCRELALVRLPGEELLNQDAGEEGFSCAGYREYGEVLLEQAGRAHPDVYLVVGDVAQVEA